MMSRDAEWYLVVCGDDPAAVGEGPTLVLLHRWFWIMDALDSYHRDVSWYRSIATVRLPDWENDGNLVRTHTLAGSFCILSLTKLVLIYSCSAASVGQRGGK